MNPVSAVWSVAALIAVVLLIWAVATDLVIVVVLLASAEVPYESYLVVAGLSLPFIVACAVFAKMAHVRSRQTRDVATSSSSPADWFAVLVAVFGVCCFVYGCGAMVNEGASYLSMKRLDFHADDLFLNLWHTFVQPAYYMVMGLLLYLRPGGIYRLWRFACGYRFERQAPPGEHRSGEES